MQLMRIYLINGQKNGDQAIYSARQRTVLHPG